MGFLQDAEAIARHAGTNTVPLKELELLRLKYDMDPEAFKPLKKKSRRGLVAVNDIQRYLVEFTQPLFEPKRGLNHHDRGSKHTMSFEM